MEQPEYEEVVREVTESEVSAFLHNGWVSLPGLVREDVAGSLLGEAQRLLGEEAEAPPRVDVDLDFEFYKNYYSPSLASPAFWDVRTNETMGRNAARLLGRVGPIRSMIDSVAAKLPAGWSERSNGAGESATHQDHRITPVRGTSMAFWVALTEITPDMGPTRFYSGSQLLGELTGGVSPHEWAGLDEFALSPPAHLRPGDATAHTSLVVHRADQNLADRVRWAWICNYFPADAPYTGEASRYVSMFDLHPEPGSPIEDESFPLVFDPERSPTG